MTKLEMLFIRACKEKLPYQRVYTLYRRMYFPAPTREKADHYLWKILLPIYENYGKVNLEKFLLRLQPDCRKDTYSLFGEQASFDTYVLQLLINEIRFIPTKDLPTDMIHPKRFR